MRSMTATEASRNFAALLDAVEAGETIVVTRDGMPVARLEPERANAATRIAEAMAAHPLPPEAVDDLERAIADLRDWQDDRERQWPDI